MFGKKETVYQGYDMAEFNMIREILDQAKIRYNWNVDDRLAHWAFPGRGTVRAYTGSAGVGKDQAKEYRISVKSEDYEKAVQVIREAETR